MCVAGDYASFEMIQMLVEKYESSHKHISTSLVRNSLVWIVLVTLLGDRLNSQQDALVGVGAWERYPCSPRKQRIERYLVSKQAELEYKASSAEGTISDYHILEQLCRGVCELHDGDSMHTTLKRLFQRHGNGLYTNFKFYGGRSPLTYAAFFGNKKMIRIMADECCGNVHRLDTVSDYDTCSRYCITFTVASWSE